MSNKIYFSIISSETEETANGFVELHDDGEKSIVYQDPLFETYITYEFPFTGAFREATRDLDIISFAKGFTDDEFGLYEFDGFTFVLNPQGINEAFLNTLVTIDKTPIGWGISKRTRCGIGSLLCKLMGFQAELFRTCPNEIKVTGFFVEGYDLTYTITGVDSEILDALEETILRMGLIIRGDSE